MSWNGSGSNEGGDNMPSSPQAKSAVTKSSVIVKGIVTVAVVITVCFAVFLIMQNSTVEEKENGVKNNVKVLPDVVKVAPKVTEPIAQEESDPAQDEEPSQKIVKVFSCTTNEATGRVCMRYQTADGLTHRWYRLLRPPTFKHGTDQLLSMLLSCDPRRGLPALPLNNADDMDAKFLASLNDPIVINPDDSESLVVKKQRVIEAREQVKALLDQGLHFRDILLDQQRLLNENAKIRNDAVRELKEIREKGDAEGERKYSLAINAAFQQMGIQPLDRPKSIDERLAERQATKMKQNQVKEK